MFDNKAVREDPEFLRIQRKMAELNRKAESLLEELKKNFPPPPNAYWPVHSHGQIVLSYYTI